MSTPGEVEKPGRRIRIVPPIYFLAAIVAMVAIGWSYPGAVLLEAPWNWLGFVPLAGGIALGGISSRLFAKHKTTIKPGHVSRQLLIDGPYRWTRNPIYLGMLTVLAGVAMLVGSATPWLLLPVFFALIAVNVIPVEEAMLIEAFGTEYEMYRARVRRWI
ncbi:MAG TPA: isoprenylcysteine carboxylmethyltransferase family protein [Pirellulales bacterium]|jgi:protein-S-isoprenylcysteine O-methyltransferase Ste14